MALGRRTRLAAVVGAGLFAVALSGCGTEDGDGSGPEKVSAEAAPAPGDGAASHSPSSKPSASSKDSQPRPGGDSEKGGGTSGGSGAQEGNSGGASGGQDGGGSGSASGGDGGSGSGPCHTSELAFRTAPGMGEGVLNVHMENTGSSACTLRGYPGVDLHDGQSYMSAARSGISAPEVSLSPGEETGFTLKYPPNDTGGSGHTITSLVVTPPGETQSKALPVSINLPVTDGTGDQVTTDPVGTGK